MAGSTAESVVLVVIGLGVFFGEWVGRARGGPTARLGYGERELGRAGGAARLRGLEAAAGA